MPVSKLFNDAFSVKIPSKNSDPYGLYKRELVDNILDHPWLSVAGLDEPEVRKGIQYAGPGDYITFGVSKNHDVSWSHTPYIGVPEYRLNHDLRLVNEKLNSFANKRKSFNTNTYSYEYSSTPTIYLSSGDKIQVFTNFIKIGYNIIPRYENIYKVYETLPIVERRVYDMFIISLL